MAAPGPFGTFAWIVLSTSDPSGAIAFYRRVFGWEAIETEITTVLAKAGEPVAAVMDYRKNDRIQKDPVNWLPFVRVEDIAVTTARILELGGSLLVPSRNVHFGRAAAVRGVTGEAIGLWQTPGPAGGAPVLMDARVCGWFELVTREPEKAAAFYRAAFGWRVGDEGGYTFIGDESGQFGGIVELAGDWEDYAFLAAIGRARGEKWSIPPHWMPFFSVDDCEAFTDAAEELGAHVTGRPESLHTLGTFAVLRDPQGVYFSVLSKR